MAGALRGIACGPSALRGALQDEEVADPVCGVAGIFKGALTTESRRECLKGMLASLHHRGPDELGYYFDDVVAMGTARLSIVDLQSGRQPMQDASGRYVIVFNGEIYNYRALRGELSARGMQLRTNSDTEVLLNAWIAWGPQALTRLNGAFAFGIYDRWNATLVLARDRFGKRPLYYVEDRGSLAFGSEMKSLLGYDGARFEFDSEQIASILTVWAPFGSQSGFAGIRQLPPGSYLSLDGRTCTVTDYAPLRLDAPPLTLEKEEAIARIRESVTASVRARLPTEVEAGVYASGGVDSAIVARLMAEQTPAPCKTFSISFEDSEFDESQDQRALVSSLGTRHTELHIGSRDIADAFPEAIWHAEVPAFRTAFVPMFLLSKVVRDSGLKVVLTGEGADEAFLGYDIFKEALLRASWSTLDPSERRSRIERLYPYLRQFSGGTHPATSALIARFASRTDGAFPSHEVRFHNSRLSLRLLKGHASRVQPLARYTDEHAAVYGSLSLVQKAQWLEYQTLLAGYLLATQGDRMSLAHSVENRCPFLDPQVTELAWATNLRFDDGTNEKHLLKAAFSADLPDRIVNKPKQPYRAPDASAFLDARPDYLELIRSEHELRKLEMLDHRFCARFAEQILASPERQLTQAENQAFVFLLSIAVLHRQFVERSRELPCAQMHARFETRIDGRGAAGER